MTDHANELRRYSRKIGHPAGDVPSVMLAAADEIERLAARLEATEEDRSRFLVEMGRLCAQCDALRLRIKAAEKERDALRARIEAIKPVAWLDDGTCRAGSKATAHRVVTNETKRDMPASVAASFSVPLGAIPGAQAQNATSVQDADELAHFIRRIDGAHDLGASALAEKIVDWLAAAPEAKP